MGRLPPPHPSLLPPGEKGQVSAPEVRWEGVILDRCSSEDLVYMQQWIKKGPCS